MGTAGLNTDPLGSTFGSVYRPQEAGGGAGNGSPTGGGIVRIQSASLTLTDATSVIRANGGNNSDRGGAGGSVWITTGSGVWSGRRRGAGRRAVVLRDGRRGSDRDRVHDGDGERACRTWWRGRGARARTNRYGGAGTIYLKGPTSTYGDLTVDNGGKTGQATELPSLGCGIAQAGTTGATLVTDRAVNIPAYFAGNWVEIRDRGATC